MSRKSWIANTKLRQVVFWLAVVLAWDLAFRAGCWEPRLFPSPEGVWRALVQGIWDHSLLPALWGSLQRAFLGYAIALLLGVSLGVLMGGVGWIDETIGSMAIALQSLPAACWLPIAMLWFGASESAVLFIIIVGGMFPIAVATDDGVRQVSLQLIQAAKTMGATPRQLALEVILPGALPFILTGMKLGWAFAWRALMTGELVIASFGLGRLLDTGRKTNDLNQVIAVMVVLVLISTAVDRLILHKIQKRVRLIWGLVRE